MASVHVMIDDVPDIEASAEVIAALHGMADRYASELIGQPLFEVGGAYGICLLGINGRNSYDTSDRRDPGVALPLRLLSSCEGIPVGFGVDPLPSPMMKELGTILDGVEFSFTASCGNDNTNVSVRFTPDGLRGGWSTYVYDEEADTHELQETGEITIPKLKRVPKKRSAPKQAKAESKKAAPRTAAAKKAAAKTSKGTPAARKKEASGGIAGKTFLFTGTLTTMTRAEAESSVKAKGGTVLSGVTDRLDYLVVGEKAGSKLAKAKKIPSITILTETEFARLR